MLEISLYFAAQHDIPHRMTYRFLFPLALLAIAGLVTEPEAAAFLLSAAR